MMAEAHFYKTKRIEGCHLDDVERTKILESVRSGPSGALMKLTRGRAPAAYPPHQRSNSPTKSTITRAGFCRRSPFTYNAWGQQVMRERPEDFSYFHVSSSAHRIHLHLSTKRSQLRSSRPLLHPSNMVWLIKQLFWFCVLVILLFVFVIPMAISAVITTSAAVGFFFFLITYKILNQVGSSVSEWWYAFITPATPATRQLEERTQTTQQHIRQVSTGTNSSGQGSVAISQPSTATPSRSHRSSSDASLSSMPIPGRDYEAVGGWKNEVNGDEETIFTNMNSGIDFGSPSRRRRSFGATSVVSSGFNSPEVVNTPLYQRAGATSSQHIRRMSGTGSPQSYFSVPANGSMTAINSRRGSRAFYSNDKIRVERESGSDDGSENAVV